MMDIGLMLPQIGYAAGRDEMVDIAQAAEEMGFSSLWVGDHVAFPQDFGESRYPFSDSGEFPTPTDLPFLEPFISLGFAAAATTRLRLGMAACVLPHRNPVLIAKSVATLDYLSGGRADFGVAVGWLRNEIEQLGGPFDGRGKYFEEVVEFLRQAWSATGPVTYTGDHVNVRDLNIQPLPPQGADVPLSVAGVSKVARRRAAEVGGWLPGLYGAPPDWVRTSVQEITSLMDRERPGSKPQVTLWAPMQFAEDDPAPDDETAQPWRTCMLLGTPDYIAAQLRAYEDAGVSRFVLWMPGPQMDKAMERFVHEVRPLLAETS